MPPSPGDSVGVDRSDDPGAEVRRAGVELEVRCEGTGLEVLAVGVGLEVWLEPLVSSGDGVAAAAIGTMPKSRNPVQRAVA